jgi:hypothetical protein
MGSHPINLTVRVLLEVSALLSMGFWGWKQSESGGRIVIAVGIPMSAAALWGTLAVPDDPSRSGSAPLAVPGSLRLALELAFFGFATWTLTQTGSAKLSVLLGVAVVSHYVASYDRILWLMKQ